jgi:hypothetical protein
MANDQPPLYEELFPNAQASPHTQPLANAPQSSSNPSLTIYFVTHAKRSEAPYDPDVPYVWHVDCTRFLAPPRSLGERYTGLDPELADSFFFMEENHQAYRDLAHIFRRELDLWRSVVQRVCTLVWVWRSGWPRGSRDGRVWRVCVSTWICIRRWKGSNGTEEEIIRVPRLGGFVPCIIM